LRSDSCCAIALAWSALAWAIFAAWFTVAWCGAASAAM
jgi:hypothetical protein